MKFIKMFCRAIMMFFRTLAVLIEATLKFIGALMLLCLCLNFLIVPIAIVAITVLFFIA